MSYLPMIIIGIIAFIIVAALIAFIVVMRRRQREEIEKLLEEQEVEMERVEEIEFDKEKSEYKAQINTFVEKKPEAVAQLLRSWLNEE